MKDFPKLDHDAKYSLCCSTSYLNSHEFLLLTMTISTPQKKQQRMVLVLTHKRVHSHVERKRHQDEIQVYWDMVLCCLVRGSHSFAGISAFICKGLGCQKNAKHKMLRGHTEDQGTTCLQDVGNHLSSDTRLYARRPASTKTMQWETHMSH